MMAQKVSEPLSEREQHRLVCGIGRALQAGVQLDEGLLYGALEDILVKYQWPPQEVVTKCSLDRRRHGRTDATAHTCLSA